ncbi:hypothetical protein [Modestobacter sp. VKM Ac-2978]|uniref:hypothetical protein n=1 Tax=Modestobacter sp. VKM Ac-2978 TaxID=3004132 RepID=UPI0022AB074B|nr:hypothetical protein [Modestobacter sp. VKM Ac-2978]MCZ2846988.1 hypothetical protein [Modestobacter sp. VKM Ac-2978]
MTAAPHAPTAPGAGDASTGVGSAGPRPVERVLYGVFIVLALLGVLSPGQFNAAPATAILELTFLATALLLARSVERGAVKLLVVGGLYLFVKTLLMVVYSEASIPDYLQAYKAFFYLVVLAFFVGKQVFDGRRLAVFTTFLVAAFLLKYGYSVVLGLSDRPGVFMENNFELILLLGLFYLAYPHLPAWRDLLFLAVAATVLLSGSRSAALGLLCIYVFLYVRTSNRTWPLHIAGVVAVGYGVLALFSARAADDGPVRLDRLNFLDTYLYEVRDWPVWEFVTGSFPLTPLSPGSCGNLSFYSVLFSSTDPGTCYSVILHSFLLRALFDHGLLGLVILYTLFWLALRRSGTPVRDVLALLGLITLSALSVSAFNSVFAAILLAVALGLDRSRPPTAPAGPTGGQRGRPRGGRPRGGRSAAGRG